MDLLKEVKYIQHTAVTMMNTEMQICAIDKSNCPDSDDLWGKREDKIETDIILSVKEPSVTKLSAPLMLQEHVCDLHWCD